MPRLRVRRSDRLLQAVSGAGRVVITTHDNPDPDAIASGWALYTLIRERLDRTVRLIGGGEIVRAENRRLIESLKPPLELVHHADLAGDVAVILVDCGYGAENHLLAETDIVPAAVIDHHPLRGPTCRVRFRDVRPRVAACASITASYLREQQMEASPRLATALVYAVRTETRGAQTRHSGLDRSVLRWLYESANPTWLAQIETAPLTRAYFGDLVLALQSAVHYGDAVFCLLPRARGPEIVGEVADLLIRCEGIRRVFCGALVAGDLVVSVRTETGGRNAARLLRKTLEGIGWGGGHRHRAGGKVPDAGRARRIKPALGDDLRRRWLDACGIKGHRGARLVSKRELIRNLSR
jgi:nanoRNase/pAp phosphatase (c-di-AMP/oligoRNAs hydrolase)